MKDGEKTYSTSQIAGIVGLHPNTVRKYEEWADYSETKAKWIQDI